MAGTNGPDSYLKIFAQVFLFWISLSVVALPINWWVTEEGAEEAHSLDVVQLRMLFSQALERMYSAKAGSDNAATKHFCTLLIALV